VFINALAILKYKIVWTVHNILPHEQESLNDTKVVRRIIKRSTLVIVHSSQILKEMADLGFETRNTRVIPIGSYDNIYTNTYSVHAARQKLLIKKNEIVILFFGIVRPYKGLEILIKAIRILNSANIKLIIAGKATENEYMLSLRTQSEGLRVEFYDQFIPDEDVCLYFAACDLVCLPFKKITTSSSVLLGMAFKKAVVVPKMGIMHDFPENSAFFYTNSTAEDLVKILRIAINQQSLRKVVELNGYEYSKSLNWQNISKLTYEAFREIL
jgi:glycosyltransferase involved in cell wall biosynthesis